MIVWLSGSNTITLCTCQFFCICKYRDIVNRYFALLSYIFNYTKRFLCGDYRLLTGNINVVQECQLMPSFKVPSEQLEQRNKNFFINVILVLLITHAVYECDI